MTATAKVSTAIVVAIVLSLGTWISVSGDQSSLTRAQLLSNCSNDAVASRSMEYHLKTLGTSIQGQSGTVFFVSPNWLAACIDAPGINEASGPAPTRFLAGPVRVDYVVTINNGQGLWALVHTSPRISSIHVDLTNGNATVRTLQRGYYLVSASTKFASLYASSPTTHFVRLGLVSGYSVDGQLLSTDYIGVCQDAPITTANSC